ncbi:MAG: GNAT family N-acetyltransferase [Candidatus Fimadaptatus sp.]|nr:GNAT family N-acetyltransferase [Candidatus Fimadaptatus sp.]
MDITYSSEHCPNDSELKELFSTVEWQVSRHIDRLSAAMYKYDNLITAWDGARLVGLVCSLDDGAVTAYINYLIVHPDYQRMGIGKELMRRILNEYRDFMRVELIADAGAAEFYDKLDFGAINAVPMCFSPDA